MSRVSLRHRTLKVLDMSNLIITSGSEGSELGETYMEERILAQWETPSWRPAVCSVRSGPGAARTILLFHTISARPSKQPRMVGSTLGVYNFGLIFVSARTNKRHHHQEQRVILDRYAIKPHNLFLEFLWFSLIREKTKFMQSHTHHPVYGVC